MFHAAYFCKGLQILQKSDLEKSAKSRDFVQMEECVLGRSNFLDKYSSAFYTKLNRSRETLHI